MVAFFLGGILLASTMTSSLAFSPTRKPWLSRHGKVELEDSGVFCFEKTRRTTGLFGKVKRGKLASSVDLSDDAVNASRKKATIKKTGEGGGGKVSKASKGGGNSMAGDEGETISPLLAQWAATSQTSSDDNDVLLESQATASTAASATKSTTATFESFDQLMSSSSSSSRSNKTSKSQVASKKSSARSMPQVVRDETATALVEQLLRALEQSSNDKKKSLCLDDILDPIQKLVTLPSATEQFRDLTVGSKTRNDYFLAWVGSDDAVSHIGSGLHKVPLARLQEVFLSLPGRNRVELLEVIRVIGPFPNVKNVLRGTSAISRSQKLSLSEYATDVTDWTITWKSMLDGTGKELLAGKQENTQKVQLHVYFCTKDVLVAVVPPNTKDVSKRRSNILEDAGKNILVFVKEDDLDLKLEKYRVA